MGSVDTTTMSLIKQPETFSKFALKEVQTKQEMEQVMDVIWAANYDPYEPFAQLIFPVLGYTDADREAAVGESKERFWQNHTADPSSHWFYVKDTETQEVVGCLQWEIHEKNPFSEGPPKLKAPWWPEGEHREFCELILKQTYASRAAWMGRRHIALNWMAVIPTHRRLGVGSFLMRFLASFSDDPSNRYEIWLEGTSMGKPMYEKFGFRPLFKVAFDAEKNNPSDVWRKCEHEMTPDPIFSMWRPVGGVWVERAEGREATKLPWELGHSST